MRVVFSRIANVELNDAAAYYEMQQKGLGQRFRSEVRQAATRIGRHPESWSVERDPIRKCLLHTFPYKLLYSIEGDHVFVIAVAHQHRRPDYWIGTNW